MKNKLIMAVVFLVGIGLGASGMVLLRGGSPADTPCSGTAARAHSYSVMVMNGKASPANVTAHRCDILTITNMDDVEREIAFGPHEDHVPYDGIAAQDLVKDQSLTLTLAQTGTFHWHDHQHDEVEGYFTVKQ